MPSRLNRCESSWNHPPHEDTTASIPMTIAIRVRPGLATGTPFPRLSHSNRETPGWQSGNEIHLNPRIDVPSHDQGDPLGRELDAYGATPIQSTERRFHQSHPYAAIVLHVSASTNECAGSRQCQERQHASQTEESTRERQLHPHWLQAVS